MPKFEFHLDKKVTSWYRETHYIDAETLEQAQKIMIHNFADGETEQTFDAQDEIDDTWEVMTTAENGDNPTMELWCQGSGLLLIDNITNQPMI